ncbi:hypothetical protein ANTRET_LOCUS361 [Anthophora retusa]
MRVQGKRKRASKDTEDSDESLTDRTPPGKKRNGEEEENIDRNRSIEENGKGGDETKTEAIRIKVLVDKGENFEEKVKEIKKRINVSKLSAMRIRRIRGSEDVLILIQGESDKRIMENRIEDAQMEMQRIGKRKDRTFMQNIEQTITEEEVRNEIRRRTGDESAEVISLRAVVRGDKNACVSMEKSKADEAIRKGWVGHTKMQCSSAVKLCYKCGEAGHEINSCKRIEERTEQIGGEMSKERMERLMTKEIEFMKGQIGTEIRTVTNEVEDTKKGTRTIGTQTEERGDCRTWAERVERGEAVGGKQKPRGMEGKVGGRVVSNKKGAAVLVKSEKKYEETLKELKERMGSPKGIQINRVRKTRTGGVLFEVDDPEKAKEWGQNIKKNMGSDINVMQLREREGIKIRGIERTIGEEIKKQIIDETGTSEEEREQLEVVRLILEP